MSRAHHSTKERARRLAQQTPLEPIIYHETYRGAEIDIDSYSDLIAARGAIDRIWSKRLFDAPNAAARAAVLAQERALQSKQINPARKGEYEATYQEEGV